MIIDLVSELPFHYYAWAPYILFKLIEKPIWYLISVLRILTLDKDQDRLHFVGVVIRANHFAKRHELGVAIFEY